MAHIAIDARIINSSTGTYIAKLLKYLQQIDTTNEYTVLVREKDKDYWKPNAPNFRTAVAEFDQYSFAEQLGYKTFLDRLAPDLVHFCMPQQPVLYAGKKVTTMHDLNLLKTWNSDKNWLIYHAKQLVGKWVFKRIARTSDHIIAISKNTKREYQEYTPIPDDKISVIYEAAEQPGATTPEPYPDLPFEEYIIYVGQQPDYKNIRHLGAVHQKMLETRPDLGFVIVGRLAPDTLATKQFFEKKGYRNIHYTGFVSDGQRDWLMANARAYVFPSLMEGFGLPPLEAMAQGAPVVSSNYSCMPEILGDAAEYFDPTDIDDTARAIGRVLDDENLRAELIRRGYKQVAKYSWEKMARETHAVYQRVLDQT